MSSKVLYICLGSNYDPALEKQCGFIQECVAKNDDVNVLSIDIRPPPDPTEHTEDHLSIQRIQFKIKEKNIRQFIQEYINDNFDEIIICDGIHFLDTTLGDTLKKEIEKSGHDDIPINVFAYISPKYAQASFNGRLLRESNVINISTFLTEKSDQLLPLFSHIHKGEIIFNQLQKRLAAAEKSNSPCYFIIENFLDSIEERMGKNNVNQFRAHLNDYIVEKITLSKIKPAVALNIQSSEGTAIPKPMQQRVASVIASAKPSKKAQDLTEQPENASKNRPRQK